MNSALECETRRTVSQLRSAATSIACSVMPEVVVDVLMVNNDACVLQAMSVNHGHYSPEVITDAREGNLQAPTRV